MEHCQGGPLMDLMNGKLEARLAEDEVLHIFLDVCQGLAHMHSQTPPLIHR